MAPSVFGKAEPDAGSRIDLSQPGANTIWKARGGSVCNHRPVLLTRTNLLLHNVPVNSKGESPIARGAIDKVIGLYEMH
jgi:hypothetical protein